LVRGGDGRLDGLQKRQQIDKRRLLTLATAVREKSAWDPAWAAWLPGDARCAGHKTWAVL
jgi:hypothetical protein